MKANTKVECARQNQSRRSIAAGRRSARQALAGGRLQAILLALTALMAHSATGQDPAANRAAATEPLDAPAPAGLRPGGTIAQEFKSPFIPPEVNAMSRPARNYPEQPPVVPHSIRGYQIDNNFNRCLTCHSRSATALSGAPMISVTHFLDRDGQVLAAVAPRRYFCLQCHVPQQDITPIISNTFKGIDEVLHEIIVERESKK